MESGEALSKHIKDESEEQLWIEAISKWDAKENPIIKYHRLNFGWNTDKEFCLHLEFNVIQGLP